MATCSPRKARVNTIHLTAKAAALARNSMNSGPPRSTARTNAMHASCLAEDLARSISYRKEQSMRAGCAVFLPACEHKPRAIQVHVISSLSLAAIIRIVGRRSRKWLLVARRKCAAFFRKRRYNFQGKNRKPKTSDSHFHFPIHTWRANGSHSGYYVPYAMSSRDLGEIQSHCVRGSSHYAYPISFFANSNEFVEY